MCRTRKYWNLFYLFGSSTTDSNGKGDPSRVVPHTDKRADNIIVEVSTRRVRWCCWWAKVWLWQCTFPIFELVLLLRLSDQAQIWLPQAMINDFSYPQRLRSSFRSLQSGIDEQQKHHTTAPLLCSTRAQSYVVLVLHNTATWSFFFSQKSLFILWPAKIISLWGLLCRVCSAF